MSDTNPVTQPPAKKRRFPRWLFLFFIVVLVSVATGGWFGWRITQTQLQQQRTSVAALRNTLLQTHQELAKLRATATKANSSLRQQSGQLESLRRDVNDLQHQVQQLGRILKGGRAHVEINEISQLLVTANQSIDLNKDPATARIALREAETLLSSLGNPRFFPVQKIIASELVSLQAIQESDITSAALELSQLIARIPQLPIQNLTRLSPQTPSGTKGVGSSVDEGWAIRTWNRAKKALGALFQVRHTDQTIVPMLSTAQDSLVAAVLNLRLDTARAALIQRNQAVFNAALQSAGAWLSRYYEPGDAAVSATQAEIAKLKKLTLSPKLPRVNRSLEVFRQIQQGSAADKKNG